MTVFVPRPNQPIAWRYCPRCGLPVILNYYPRNISSKDYSEDIEREIDGLMEEHLKEPHSGTGTER